jgi:hypothetical protein
MNRFAAQTSKRQSRDELKSVQRAAIAKKFCALEKFCVGDQKIVVTFILFRHTLAVRYLSPME